MNRIANAAASAWLLLLPLSTPGCEDRPACSARDHSHGDGDGFSPERLEAAEEELIRQMGSADGPQGIRLEVEADPDLDQAQAVEVARQAAPPGFRFSRLLRLTSGREVRFYVPDPGVPGGSQ